MTGSKRGTRSRAVKKAWVTRKLHHVTDAITRQHNPNPLYHTNEVDMESKEFASYDKRKKDFHSTYQNNLHGKYQKNLKGARMRGPKK